MKKMYFVYVLSYKKEKKKNIYDGYCRNLKARLKKHFNKEIRSTKTYEFLKLVYYEVCLNKKDARKREIQLKTGFSRGYLKRRLESYLLSGIS